MSSVFPGELIHARLLLKYGGLSEVFCLQAQINCRRAAVSRQTVVKAQSNGASGASNKASPYVSNPYADELRQTAKAISNRGRGILASDESNVTTGKRLASVGEPCLVTVTICMRMLSIAIWQKQTVPGTAYMTVCAYMHLSFSV